MNALTLLGVKGGPAIRPGAPMPTSSLLELDGQRVLIDAGLGAAQGVVRAGVGLCDLDAIVITHLHSDHYLDLGPLLHTAWTAGLSRVMPIYGPAGLDHYWQHFCEAMRFDIDLRIADEGRPDLRGLVALNPIEHGARIGPLALSVLRNDHPPIRDSFALRFDGSRSVTLSGDTAPMEAMAGFAARSDLLVHEAMLTAGIDALCARVGNGDDRLRRHLERSHTPAAEAARIATKAGVGALALHHLIPSDDPDYGDADWLAELRPHWDGPLHLGRDGMRIKL